MLKEYTSIPKKRFACQIEETGELEKIEEGIAKYTNKVGAVTELVEFQYTEGQKPEAGDYLVQESKNKYYLEKKEEFEADFRSTGFKLR